MIKISREGKEVQVRFDHGIIPEGWTIIRSSVPDKIFAQLLVDRLTHELEKALSSKIEQAYLEGHKSEKNHEKKKTKFIGTFDTQIW